MSTALFQPRYLKEASLLVQHARRLLHRRRDVMSHTTVVDIESEIGQLESAIANRDERAVKEKSEQLDVVFSKSQPVRADAGWRENCEVLLVAFVLAIAIRSYFLQPFKIPTGSMQPTLNGIIGRSMPVKEPLPGFLSSTFQGLWLGRSYVDAVSKVDDEVVDVRSEKRFIFQDYTRIKCRSGASYLVHAPIRTVESPTDGFGVFRGRDYRAGDPIARGYVDTGDQVFVDKFTYNFRLPRREDVFVFSTAGIERIQISDPMVKSEFYIKRLAGLPGDSLRIAHPQLFINGTLAKGPRFERVMADTKDGYRGYSNTVGMYLRTGSDTFDVPLTSYFALGDNSYNSADSRAWGIVPSENVVGRGLFVYWPFSKHWGLIY